MDRRTGKTRTTAYWDSRAIKVAHFCAELCICYDVTDAALNEIAAVAAAAAAIALRWVGNMRLGWKAGRKAGSVS